MTTPLYEAMVAHHHRKPGRSYMRAGLVGHLATLATGLPLPTPEYIEHRADGVWLHVRQPKTGRLKSMRIRTAEDLIQPEDIVDLFHQGDQGPMSQVS